SYVCRRVHRIDIRSTGGALSVDIAGDLNVVVIHSAREAKRNMVASAASATTVVSCRGRDATGYRQAAAALDQDGHFQSVELAAHETGDGASRNRRRCCRSRTGS